MLGRHFFRQSPTVMKSAHRLYSLSPEQRKKIANCVVVGLGCAGSAVVLVALSIMIKELTGYGHSRAKKQANSDVDCELLLKTYLACAKKTDAYREQEVAKLEKPPAP